MRPVCIARAALQAAVDSGNGECASLLMARGARAEAPPRAAAARKQAKAAGERFHWDRGLASQNWWVQDGLPKQSRRCRELDAQLTQHVLSAVPDAQLLETPLDRFHQVERQHALSAREEAQRRAGVAARERAREAKLSAWHERVEGAAMRSSARREQAALMQQQLAQTQQMQQGAPTEAWGERPREQYPP